MSQPQRRFVRFAVPMFDSLARFRRGVVGLGSALLLAALCLLAVPSAQAQPPAAPDEFKPVDVDITTKDGVLLRMTYYPGKNGKDSVPIILLHMFGGNRGDWKSLAELLHADGHALMALDLRGHGDSTRLSAGGKTITLKDVENRIQIERMFADDLESLKSWIITEHNAGKMNVERLCVIGAEMGAVVALNWAAIDWKWPVLAGGGKQGQDVQGLILLSPESNFKGVRTDLASTLLAQHTPISVQVVVGQNDSKSASNAEQIYRLFSRHRETKFKTEAEARANQNLFMSKHPTTLQGTKMLGKNLGVEPRCKAFIALRLVDKNIPWRERVSILNK